MIRLEYEGKSMPATADRVNEIMKDGRTARRLLSEGRSAEKAHERSARLRSIKEARDEREYSQQKRKLLRELGLQPDSKAWGQVFHVKVDKAPEGNKRRSERKINPTKPRWAYVATKLPFVMTGNASPCSSECATSAKNQRTIDLA